MPNVTCPNCHREFRLRKVVDYEIVAPCPKCRHPITVPATSSHAASATSSRRPLIIGLAAGAGGALLVIAVLAAGIGLWITDNADMAATSDGGGHTGHVTNGSVGSRELERYKNSNETAAEPATTRAYTVAAWSFENRLTKLQVHEQTVRLYQEIAGSQDAYGELPERVLDRFRTRGIHGAAIADLETVKEQAVQAFARTLDANPTMLDALASNREANPDFGPGAVQQLAQDRAVAAAWAEGVHHWINLAFLELFGGTEELAIWAGGSMEHLIRQIR